MKNLSAVIYAKVNAENASADIYIRNVALNATGFCFAGTYANRRARSNASRANANAKINACTRNAQSFAMSRARLVWRVARGSVSIINAQNYAMKYAIDRRVMSLVEKS